MEDEKYILIVDDSDLSQTIADLKDEPDNIIFNFDLSNNTEHFEALADLANFLSEEGFICLCVGNKGNNLPAGWESFESFEEAEDAVFLHEIEKNLPNEE